MISILPKAKWVKATLTEKTVVASQIHMWGFLGGRNNTKSEANAKKKTH